MNFLTGKSWRDAWRQSWGDAHLREVWCAVAYASDESVNEMRREWEKNRPQVRFFAGAEKNSTQLRSLRHWQDEKEVEVRLIEAKTGRFHPKLYVFFFESDARVFIGSANLTRAAFTLNDETMLECFVPVDSAMVKQIQTIFAQWSQRGRTLSDELLEEFERAEETSEREKERHEMEAQFAQFLARQATNSIVLELPQATVEARLLGLMERGIVVDVQGSQRELHVDLPKDSFKIGAAVKFTGEVLSLEQQNQQNIFLLTRETRQKFKTLQNQARDCVRDWAFPFSLGDFVPCQCVGDWQSEFEKRKRDFELEVHSRFGNHSSLSKERATLKEQTPKDCQDLWRRLRKTKGQAPDPMPTTRVNEVVKQVLTAFDEARKNGDFARRITLERRLRRLDFGRALLGGASNGQNAGEDLIREWAQRDKEKVVAEWAAILITTTRQKILVECERAERQKVLAKCATILSDLTTRLRLLNFYEDGQLESLCVRLDEAAALYQRKNAGVKTLASAKALVKEVRNDATFGHQEASRWSSCPHDQVLKEFAARTRWS